MLRAEVAIIGAGPAGARAAELLASQGAEVVLIDSRAPWEKPCGGGLTPRAFLEIPELDDLKPRARPVTSVRVESGPDRGFTVDLDHPMWILSRRTLAEWQLSRAVGAGAEHLPARVKVIERTTGGWHLQASDCEVSVGVLVGADGAASLVRRVASPGFRVELAPTRVVYPWIGGPAPETVVLRFYPGVVGYLWDFPRPDHRSVGVMVPGRAWRRARMDAEIDDYRASSERCECPSLERAGAVIGTAWLGHGDSRALAGRDFALLGDAAGLADPFTGEGIRNAMRSSGLLAEAWVDGKLGAYPALVHKTFGREFRASRLVRRWIFETGAGVRLVEKGAASRTWYAAVAAIVNGLNEHDGRVSDLLARWTRSIRARPAGAGAPNEVRRAVPCGGQCAHHRRRGDSGSSPRAA